MVGDHTLPITGSRDPLIGTLVAERYRILQLVGRGGMGVVYKARHEMMERTVAIKMLLPQLMADEGAAARFQREARASSRINHSNIISLHDFGKTEEGVPYIVMDFIEGESLADVLKRERQLGTSRCAHIFTQVCDALAHAHELGIIHRDLKPGNIMLLQTEDAHDVVKVVDFGIAKMYESEEGEMQKLTSTGELFGSPVYMSPEQCGGYELDLRSDIYSLGCVMYETLTGKLPCVGKTVLETISRQISATPPPFSAARADLFIPDWMESIVMRALSKDPARRQQSMRQVQDEIGIGISSHSSVSVRALNPNHVSMRTRAVSPGPQNARPQQQSQAPDEWKRYALYTVAVVTLLGGAMFAISMFPNHAMNQQTQVPRRIPVPVKPAVKETPPKQEVKHEDPAPATTPTPPPKQAAPPPEDKPVPQPVVKPKPRRQVRAPKPAIEESPPPVKHISRKHRSDFYDFHPTGDPTPLPVKEWSPDQ